MSPKNTPYKGAKTDDLDDERIRRLIARYAHIHDTSKERQVGDFKTDTNYAADSCSTLGRTKSLMQADPIVEINYMYRILSNDNAEREKYGGSSRVRLTWDDCYYDSLHSHSHDTESSIPNKRRRISKSKVTFRDKISDIYQQTSFNEISSNENIIKRSYAEKSTYCRPVNKTYDNNFVHRVMEKNAKLQLLLTKYVIARQKEKEKQKWSDYVLNLIEKRRCYRDLSTNFSSPFMREGDTHPLLMKHFSTENKLVQAESCQEILHDLYSPRNELCPEISPKFEASKTLNNKTIGSVYANQLICFPSSSQVKATDKERTNHEWTYHRNLYRPSVILSNEDISIDKDNCTKMYKHTDLPISTGATNIDKSCQAGGTYDIEPESKDNKDIQTYITFGSYRNLATEPELVDMVSELHVHNDKVTRKTTRGRATQCNHDNEISQLSKLTSKQKVMKQSLERQHEIFNNLFRSFMTDLKMTQNLNVVNSNNFHIRKIDETTNSTRTGLSKPRKKVTIVGNVMTNTSLSAFELERTTSQHSLNSRFDKILYEELDKSNKLRSDIEAMLNSTAYRPCAVQISIDIPTRERSTEITDSLSKTRLPDSLSQKMVIEDVSSPTNCRIPRTRQKYPDKRDYVKSERRIAVNTDPVGLLSLLKLSTETAKQILSFVPNMNWYPPRALPASRTTTYVCNVCGAIFARPSELSAHILEHNLGQVRCCRLHSHAPEPPDALPLFRCQYCGQQFTRAHCCELHQCSCARRNDKRHVSSSLVMLR